MRHRTAARGAGVWGRSVGMAACMGLAAVAARADSIPAAKQNEELQHRSSGTPEYAVSQAQPNTGFRVGYQSSFLPTATNAGGIDALYFFKLPALPAGQTVSSATFSVSELKTATGAVPTFNVDLYAVGIDRGATPANDNPESSFGSAGVPSSNISPAYFFVGPQQTGAAGAGGLPVTRVADNLFTATEFNAATANGNAPRTTDGDQSSPLAQYLRNLYNDPANANGGYLLLRLTPDAPNDGAITGTMRYQFPYAPDTGTGGITYPSSTYGNNIVLPQLDVTFTPEPTGAALVGLAASALLARRRRAMA